VSYSYASNSPEPTTVQQQIIRYSPELTVQGQIIRYYPEVIVRQQINRYGNVYTTFLMFVHMNTFRTRLCSIHAENFTLCATCYTAGHQSVWVMVNHLLPREQYFIVASLYVFLIFVIFYSILLRGRVYVCLCVCVCVCQCLRFCLCVLNASV
jgi:hypothetical protein